MREMNAIHDGVQTFGLPILSVEEYLNLPRHARWPIHLCFGLMIHMCTAFTECDRETILLLVGARELE
jgi:hypothetical protein